MSVPDLPCPSNNKPNADPLWGVVRFFPGDSDFHPEPGFDRMLYLERKRTERSRRPFMLLLLNVEDLMPGSDEDPFVRELETAPSSCVRETENRINFGQICPPACWGEPYTGVPRGRVASPWSPAG